MPNKSYTQELLDKTVGGISEKDTEANMQDRKMRI